MSSISAPLRDLSRNNVPFEWNENHTVAFNKLRQIITNPLTLKIYDSNLPLEIQTDASKNGLGACLMQAGHPIAFASRALNETEKNYAIIEKEMLAINFALEKFNFYCYGRHVTIFSDHKPLESIFKKKIKCLHNNFPAF